MQAHCSRCSHVLCCTPAFRPALVAFCSADGVSNVLSLAAGVEVGILFCWLHPNILGLSYHGSWASGSCGVCLFYHQSYLLYLRCEGAFPVSYAVRVKYLYVSSLYLPSTCSSMSCLTRPSFGFRHQTSLNTHAKLPVTAVALQGHPCAVCLILFATTSRY